MSKIKDIETLTPKEYAKRRIAILKQVNEVTITHKQEQHICGLPTTIAIDHCLYDIINGIPKQPVYYRAWCGGV